MPHCLSGELLFVILFRHTYDYNDVHLTLTNATIKQSLIAVESKSQLDCSSYRTQLWNVFLLVKYFLELQLRLCIK